MSFLSYILFEPKTFLFYPAGCRLTPGSLFFSTFYPLSFTLFPFFFYLPTVRHSLTPPRHPWRRRRPPPGCPSVAIRKSQLLIRTVPALYRRRGDNRLFGPVAAALLLFYTGQLRESAKPPNCARSPARYTFRSAVNHPGKISRIVPDSLRALRRRCSVPLLLRGNHP